MFTEFSIISGVTVSKDYSWDHGIPLTGTNIVNVTPNTGSSYISGYAPGVKVFFKNNSISDSDFSKITYNWDFGDYYNNSSNNISIPCTNNIEHIFIMPGIYTITLTHRQSKIRQDFDYVANSDYCKSKYDFRWFWDNMVSVSGDSLTWDETGCTAKYSKWWDNEVACFAKYCKFWNWFDLRSAQNEGINPVTWEETYQGNDFEKKWEFEANSTLCDSGKEATFIDTLVASEQTYTITNTVEVLEIKPQAFLYSYTHPVTGVAPFAVHLTPKFTIPGSFAIERIDWDFGDGSSVQTVWRHQPPTSTLFTLTSTFSADPKDPRNYDAIYTYKRALNTYPVFYPSITAYSGSTNSHDACSIVIGPVSLSSVSSKLHILKTKALDNSNFYALQVDRNTTFVATQTSGRVLLPTITTPPNPIKNVIPQTIVYKGNPGTGYPPVFNPPC